MFDKQATTKSLSEKPVFGTPSPRPLFTSSTLEPTMRPASSTPDSWSPLRQLDNLPPLPTFEPFDKKLAPNTTAPTHVGKPPPLPTSESFEKKLASNMTDSRSEYYNKLLGLFTFNPNSKELASNTSLFHFTPFKPINDWKPLKMPDYKPKLNSPSPAPASGQTGPLVIAKAIAGLSGCTVIIVLICCCIYSKRINQTQKERRPRRDNGLQPWCYGSQHSFNLDLGDDPPRYSYTNPEDTKSHNHNQEIDVTLEMGTDLCFDMNCYDNDTGGGSSNDCCVQD